MGVAVLLGGAVVPTSARADEAPGTGELGPIGSLPGEVAQVVASAAAPPLDLGAELGLVEGEPHLVVLSSGIEAAALPEGLRDRLTLYGTAGDQVGYGTFAASVLFQVAPRARVTSINVYPGGRADATSLYWSLRWAADQGDTVDAVLLAVPPSDFLDPVSAAMAAGEWDAMGDALAATPSPGGRGPVLGLPLDDRVFAAHTAGLPWHQSVALQRFRWLVTSWAAIRHQIQRVVANGAPVVVPAGDTGPNPQSVLGVANLPEVITVGGFDGEGVSAASAAGPAADGRVKPDLLAPTGVVGVLPPRSALAKFLRDRGLLDPGLVLGWDHGEPPTDARSRLDSTLGASAVVAGGVAGLAASGVRDVARQRGALMAAAEPIRGVATWKQGAGVLEQLPDREFATSRPLALAHADLGAEPAAGEWSTTVPVVQGEVVDGRALAPDLIAITPAATNDIVTLADEHAPSPTVSVAPDGAKITVEARDEGTPAGELCGYVRLRLAAGTVSAGGASSPEIAEDVPLCLVNGFRLGVGRALYLHDTSAADETFTLAPALPAGASLLDHPLHLLPLNPLDAQLFHAVTSNDAPCPPNPDGTRCGHAWFTNVPPGYYKVRLFGDYGAPVTSTVTGAEGQAQRIDQELGANPAYQAFKTLLLPPAPGCAEAYKPSGDWTAGWKDCTEQFLQAKLVNGAAATAGQPGPIEYSAPTASWRVGPTVGGERQLVNLGFLRKLVGTNVVSRYVDLVTPCTDFEYLTLRSGDVLRLDGLHSAVPALDELWQSACRDTADALAAPLSSGSGGTTVVNYGLARYPFRLATPNYSAHMSLNFSYHVRNGAIVVAVQVGQDWNVGVVTPAGTFELPSVNGQQPLDLGTFQTWGDAAGRANFEFRMLPRGAREGTVYVVFVPPNDTSLATADVGDFSFELDTWTNTDWPPVDFTDNVAGACNYGKPAADGTRRTNYCGHVFSFDSGFSPRRTDPSTGRVSGQISGDCRRMANGAAGAAARSATVCEDWTVMVHSPHEHDGAIGGRLMDVVDVSATNPSDPRPIEEGHRSLMADLAESGGGVSFPARGVSDFSVTLAYGGWPVEAEAKLQPLRTNGAFWEQLVFPMAFLADHDVPIRVCIQDGAAPGQEPLTASLCTPERAPILSLPEAPGAVPVAPYVPFAREAKFLGL